MISDRTLGAALDQQVLTAAQVDWLRAREAATPLRDREPEDDEKLRFITGFGDVFVAIGLALFLGSLSFLAGRQFGSVGMYAAPALGSWALAEFFTRRRRMALPSILLLLSFLGCVFMTAAASFGQVNPFALFGGRRSLAPMLTPVLMASLVTVLAGAVHYLRFRVPITFAAAAAALIGALAALLAGLAPDVLWAWHGPLLFACGIAVFTAAMRFDMSDPQRLTRRTDIAFWLHMLAAPLIVKPLISGFAGTATPWWPVIVLVLFLLLGLVAVLVDRRALLVSGLSYAGYALGALVSQSGLVTESVPLTLLVLGGFVLLLSARWQWLRHVIIARLPDGLVRRLPRPV